LRKIPQNPFIHRGTPFAIHGYQRQWRKTGRACRWVHDSRLKSNGRGTGRGHLLILIAAALALTITTSETGFVAALISAGKDLSDWKRW